MRSEYGDVTIKIPRDRKGEFEPQVIKKYQKDLGSIEQRCTIVCGYTAVIACENPFKPSTEQIRISSVPLFLSSFITLNQNLLVSEIREWQNRPLKRLYAMVFMDAIHYHVRKEGSVVNKAVYIAIGIDMSGCTFGI